MLGEYPCSGHWCNALVRTDDSGRHFTRVAAPPFPSQGPVPSLVFANSRDGFAYVSYESSPLYSTHDGGASWQQAGPGGVTAFAVSGGDAYAVFRRKRFERSPVSRDAWLRLPLPFSVGGGPVDLAARGSQVWLVGTTPARRPRNHSTLARSTDRGLHFTLLPSPCFPGLGGGVTSAGGHVLWATCSSGMLGEAFRSTNDGLSFRPLRTPPLVNAAAIAPSSVRAAVLARGIEAPLLRTADGGRTWRRVRQPTRLLGGGAVSFSAPRVGIAVAQVRRSGIENELWRTTDGGATWHSIPIR